MTTVLYALRFLLATALNAGLLVIAGLLKTRGEPWQEFVFGGPWIVAVFLVPSMLGGPRGWRGARPHEIVYRSALSWLLAGIVLDSVLYYRLGRLPGLPFAVATAILFSLCGAFSGWIGSGVYAFLVGKRYTPQR